MQNMLWVSEGLGSHMQRKFQLEANLSVKHVTIY